LSTSSSEAVAPRKLPDLPNPPSSRIHIHLAGLELRKMARFTSARYAVWLRLRLNNRFGFGLAGFKSARARRFAPHSPRAFAIARFELPERTLRFRLRVSPTVRSAVSPKLGIRTAPCWAMFSLDGLALHLHRDAHLLFSFFSLRQLALARHGYTIGVGILTDDSRRTQPYFTTFGGQFGKLHRLFLLGVSIRSRQLVASALNCFSVGSATISPILHWSPTSAACWMA
jgi:hypothetical protein